MEAKEIIEKFGGLAEMSRKTDVSTSTIQYWYEKNSIPHWRLAYLKQKAKEYGFDLKFQTSNDNDIPDIVA